MENNKQPYRSLFWPILLIGLGVLWLLGSFNLIPNLSLAMLGVLWPVILIVIGLDILFARRLPWISGLIALLVIALLVFMLIGAPALGLKITPRVVTEQFSEPIGEAQSARLDLDLVEFPSTITPLQNSTNLIDASLTHAGRVIFTTSGEKQKSVSLGYERPNLNLSLTGPMDWKIGITPDLPLDLNIDGGSGSLNANLSGLDLMNFFIDVRSGSVKLILPASQESYPSEVIGGSGSLKMDIEDGARTEMRFESHSGSVQVNIGGDVELVLRGDTGSGSVRFIVPADAEVRLEVLQSGSGSVNVAERYEKISGRGAREGVWQSAGWETAAKRIHIIIEDQGSGSITLR